MCSLKIEESIWKMPDPLGILSIHASAVQINGGALIFLGPSGAGKSTIVGLMAGFAEKIADDVIYLVPRAKNLWDVVGGDQESKKKAISHNNANNLLGPTLRSIIILQKSSRNSLKELSPSEICIYLTNSYFEISRHRKFSVAQNKLAFHKLAKISMMIPGYKLLFNLSASVSEIILDEVGNL
jgi:energy-coupling factor transporter ATP-binding protein EcfA2